MRDRLIHIAAGTGALFRETLQGAAEEWFPPVIDPHPVGEDGEQWQPDTAADYCVRCGVTTGPGAATLSGCAACLGRRFPWQRVTRIGRYAEPLNGWIRTMKFAGEWARAEWLGQRLAEAVGQPMHEAGVVVCPVPMPLPRRMWRGYDQA